MSACLMRGLALLISCLMLSGCAARNVRTDYTPASDKGLMLGSITRDGRQSAYRVMFRPVGQEKGFDFVETGCDSIVEPSCYARQDFEAIGMKGDLFAVELPPGDYEFFTWDVVGGSLHAGPGSIFSLKYPIRAGRVTYVGNFHFTETASRGFAVTAAEVDYTLPFERDWALAQAKHPHLQTEAVDVNGISPETPKIGGSGGYSVVPTPVYLPPAK